MEKKTIFDYSIDEIYDYVQTIIRAKNKIKDKNYKLEIEFDYILVSFCIMLMAVSNMFFENVTKDYIKKVLESLKDKKMQDMIKSKESLKDNNIAQMLFNVNKENKENKEND